MAVAVSGGWDSLGLALLLVRHNGSIQRPLRLRGLHVPLTSDGVTGGLDPAVRRWCTSIGLEVVDAPPRLEPTEEVPLDCFRCARIRRRTLLERANELGCSHLALGHHADDVVETWLLGLMYTGRAEVVPPTRSYFGGVVTLVRPLYEVQKRELGRLCRLAGCPEPASTCAREQDSRRVRVAHALSAMGRDERLVRRQLFWAAVHQLEAGDARPAE